MKTILAIDSSCPAAAEWSGEPSINFYYRDSEDFTDSVAATWNPQEIVGRSEAYLIYANTQNTEIPMTAVFPVTGDDDHGEESAETAKRKANWIKACTYPTYKNRIMIPPPTLIMSQGLAYDHLRGIIENVEITQKAPFDVEGDYGTYLSLMITVTFQFKQVNDEPLTFNDILGEI